MQQLVFLERERQLLAAGAHGVRGGVALDVPAAQRLAALAAELRPAQQSAHAGDQLHHAERLCKIIIRAAVQPHHLIVLLILSRKHNNRHTLQLILPPPDNPNRRKTIHAGKHQIKNRQIRLLPPNNLQRFLRSLKSRHLIAITFQSNFHQIPDILIILNHKYLLHPTLHSATCHYFLHLLHKIRYRGVSGSFSASCMRQPCPSLPAVPDGPAVFSVKVV